jgi:hypothetical protein
MAITWPPAAADWAAIGFDTLAAAGRAAIGFDTLDAAGRAAIGSAWPATDGAGGDPGAAA